MNTDMKKAKKQKYVPTSVQILGIEKPGTTFYGLHVQEYFTHNSCLYVKINCILDEDGGDTYNCMNITKCSLDYVENAAGVKSVKHVSINIADV